MQRKISHLTRLCSQCAPHPSVRSYCFLHRTQHLPRPRVDPSSSHIMVVILNVQCKPSFDCVMQLMSLWVEEDWEISWEISRVVITWTSSVPWNMNLCSTMDPTDGNIFTPTLSLALTFFSHIAFMHCDHVNELHPHGYTVRVRGVKVPLCMPWTLLDKDE